MPNSIELFNVDRFFFSDNDLVGRDIDSFDFFLDNLICLKNRHEDFEITLSEIISNGLNAAIIKKIALAGFAHAQIGFESPSDALLTKISKKTHLQATYCF